MINIEGFIKVQRFIGSELLLIDDKPIAKKLQKLNGKQVILSINCHEEFSYTLKGVAEIFYFEGTQAYYRGTKYVTDFFIDEFDVIELLEQHEGKKIKLTITLMNEDIQ